MSSFDPIPIKISKKEKERQSLIEMTEKMERGRSKNYVLRIGDFTCCGFTVLQVKKHIITKNHQILGFIDGKTPIYISDRVFKKTEEIDRLRTIKTISITRKRGLFGEYFYLEYPEAPISQSKEYSKG